MAEKRKKKTAPPPRIDTRLALRRDELAQALGVSERTIQNLAREIPVIRRGGLILYPVDGAKRWLERASYSDAEIDDKTDELLKE